MMSDMGKDGFSGKAMVKAYEALHKWVDKSVEPVRSELARILFPVVASAYIALVENEDEDIGLEFLRRWEESHNDTYKREINELKNHDTYFDRVQNSHYILRLSPVAAELLGEFLTRTASVSIIKLLNEKVCIEIRQVELGVDDSRKPLLEEDEGQKDTLLSKNQAKKKKHNQSLGESGDDLYLGTLRESIFMYYDENAMLNKGHVPPSFVGKAPDSVTNAYASALLRDQARRRLDEAEPIGRHHQKNMEPAALMAAVTGGDAELICCMKPSQDARRVAAGSSDSSLRVWCLDAQYKQFSQQDLKPKNSRLATAHRGPLYSLSWSTEGRFLLTGGADGCTVLWDTEENFNSNALTDDAPTAICRYRCHGSRPTWSVAFCQLSAGHLFATAGGDRSCRIFATERLEPLRIFIGHWSQVLRTAWHPNAHYVASCDATSVRLWDIRAAGGITSKSHCVRVLEPLTSNGADFSALDISADGQYAAAADRNGFLHIWHLDSGKTIAAGQTQPKSSLDALAFSRDSATLATGGTDCMLRLWDANSINLDSRSIEYPRQSFKTRSSTPIFDITWTPSNLCLVSGALVASS